MYKSSEEVKLDLLSKKIERRTKVQCLCSECNKVMTYNAETLLYKEKFICLKCLYKTKNMEDIVNKKKQTSLKNYGVEFYSQLPESKERYRKWMSSKEFKEKSLSTLEKKYGKGIRSPLQVDSIKKRSKQKANETNFKKYGVKEVFSSKEIYEKRNATMLQKYGVEVPAKSQEIRNKINETNIKKYGRKGFGSKDSEKATLMSKYGVDHNWKIPGIAQKAKLNRIKKYGDNCNYKKVQQTLQQRYGVDNPGFLKSFISWVFKNVFFDSFWEFCFYVYHYKHKNDITRNKKFFILENGNRFYPDFNVNGTLIEIKSSYIMKKQDNWSLKEKLCKKYNIKIISNREIKFYLNYIKTIFSSKEIKTYKIQRRYK